MSKSKVNTALPNVRWFLLLSWNLIFRWWRLVDRFCGYSIVYGPFLWPRSLTRYLIEEIPSKLIGEDAIVAGSPTLIKGELMVLHRNWWRRCHKYMGLRQSILVSWSTIKQNSKIGYCLSLQILFLKNWSWFHFFHSIKFFNKNT